MTVDGGYSGTPLPQKLGITPGAVVAVIDEPSPFRSYLGPVRAQVAFRESLRGRPDIVMLFITGRASFERRLPVAARAVFPAGAIWVAWPRRASGVGTDMSGDAVRSVALPRGLVDNKVCSIDGTWTALRLVWRVEHRGLDAPPVL